MRGQEQLKLLGGLEQLVEAAGRSGAIGLSCWEFRSNWLKLLGDQEQLVESAGRSGAIG